MTERRSTTLAITALDLRLAGNVALADAVGIKAQEAYAWEEREKGVTDRLPEQDTSYCISLRGRSITVVNGARV